ncbi:MAG: hypothetical protein EHM33_00335 [Chloroflexi bacterium]|nr:MAG: hypothetical protein EHM33_00335 [Chloroflexota bacterium]
MATKYWVKDPATGQKVSVEAGSSTEAAAKFRAGDYAKPKGVMQDVAEQAPSGLLRGTGDLINSVIPDPLMKLGELAKPYIGANPYDIKDVGAALTGGLPEAETGPGKLVNAIGEVAPSVALNPGKIPLKVAETVLGGGGSFIGEEIGGPWGKLIGTITGLATPRAVARYANRASTTALDNLKEAGLNSQKVKALAHDRGLLPADVTEKGASLLETAMKRSTDPETGRIPFTKRPVKDQAVLDVGREVAPGLGRVEDLKGAADTAFGDFRKKPNVPYNKQLDRTLKIPVVASIVKKIKGGMTPYEQRHAMNSKNVSTAFLERVRSHLSGAASSATNPAEQRHLRKLANTLVASTKDKDWSAAVKLSQRDLIVRDAERNIGSVLSPKMNDTDLVKNLKDLTGKAPSQDLIKNIRDMQRMARTNEAAGGERIMRVETPTHPGAKVAGSAAAAATGHPFAASALGWSGIKDIVRSITKGSEGKRADKLVRALADPNDPLWDYKPPKAITGAPGLLSAFERFNRGQN